jgi:hypothetical protein
VNHSPQMMRDLAKIQLALRTMAERDVNDILANSASDLSSQLDSVGTTFGMKLIDITITDQQIIQYALKNYQSHSQLNLPKMSVDTDV